MVDWTVEQTRRYRCCLLIYFVLECHVKSIPPAQKFNKLQFSSSVENIGKDKGEWILFPMHCIWAPGCHWHTTKTNFHPNQFHIGQICFRRLSGLGRLVSRPVVLHSTNRHAHCKNLGLIPYLQQFFKTATFMPTLYVIFFGTIFLSVQSFYSYIRCLSTNSSPNKRL